MAIINFSHYTLVIIIIVWDNGSFVLIDSMPGGLFVPSDILVITIMHHSSSYSSHRRIGTY